MVLLVGGSAAWLWTRRDLAAELLARQRAIVASPDRLSDAEIDSFVRTADRLSPTEARAVRTALGAEWRRLKLESIDRYFSAPDADRPALLDEDIARMQKYHRLLASLNPMDMPGGPVWAPRPPRSAPNAEPKSPDAEQADKTRRDLETMYNDARAARAKERGITLPQFR